MIIDYDLTIQDLITKVENGKKYFYRIDFGEGEAINRDFDNVVFKECIMSVDFSKSTFRNSKFLNSNIKCCIFNRSDLSNSTIENCSVERVELREAILDGIVFNNNYCYGTVLNQKDLVLLDE